MCGPGRCLYGGSAASIPLRGLLNLAILCVIKQKPTYGGEIHQKLKEDFGITAPRPLIYTLLRRMEKNGLVASTWDIRESGPARRIYTITEEGLEFLNSSVEGLKNAVEVIGAIVRAVEEA
ncbi:PadR family transcriptional regulator [archaeon]|nr:MAG: PadR family transcriptional regulator [archaeon]